MSYLFHGQRSNEEVVLIAKQHPFVLFHPFFVSTLVLLIPFAATIFFNFTPFFAAIVFLCLVFGLLHAFLAFYAWNNSVLLLTTERIVMLYQKSVLHREFSEVDLKSIQQVSHEVKGLLHTIFGFGNINVYTGGSQAPFLIPNIPDPYDVQQEILRVAHKEGFIEE